MIEPKDKEVGRRSWVMPEVRELDVRETWNLPRRGADVRGNPTVDCQRS